VVDHGMKMRTSDVFSAKRTTPFSHTSEEAVDYRCRSKLLPAGRFDS
jgi:hypothetical protein